MDKKDISDVYRVAGVYNVDALFDKVVDLKSSIELSRSDIISLQATSSEREKQRVESIKSFKEENDKATNEFKGIIGSINSLEEDHDNIMGYLKSLKKENDRVSNDLRNIRWMILSILISTLMTHGVLLITTLWK